MPASTSQTVRQEASPPLRASPAVSALATTIPIPIPEPVKPIAAPRRCGGTTDPARPGAGTQMNAPASPVSDRPAASTPALSAWDSRASPSVVPTRPQRISVAGSARRASALTAIVPSRYAPTFAVPSSPATA